MLYLKKYTLNFFMKKRNFIACFIFTCLSWSTYSCSFGQGTLEKIMQNKPKEFQYILQNKDKFPLEIIFTRIFRDKNNQASFENHTYFTENNLYFNPASLIKLPICALTLQKLHEIKNNNIDLSNKIVLEKGFPCQETALLNDSTPSIAQHIQKLLILSDNEGYNKLYEFLGQKYIKTELEKRNYRNTKIIRRFAECDTLQNRYSNPIKLYTKNNELSYEQGMIFNDNPFYPYQSSWKKPKISTPMNIFNKDYQNEISLEDAHNILMSILLPEGVDYEKRFKLSTYDYNFLWENLAKIPQEINLSKALNEQKYFPSYKKYLFYGRKKNAKIAPNIRIFNVVGWWGGVVSDCAYFVDFENKIEFFLSARIGLNSPEINEAVGYQKYSFPFMENLGKAVYEYEKEKLKEKSFLPDLNRYKKLFE